MNTTVPAVLRMLSDSLDDIENVRKATANRHRFSTRDVADSDGAFRGLGLDKSHPIVALSAITLEGLEDVERTLVKGLEKEVGRTIYGPWVKAQTGLGAKTIGRLLGSVGDPYLREAIDPDTGSVTYAPRTLRQLWAYSGLAVDGPVARHPRAGMSQADVFALGKATSKMRAFLVSQGLVKAGVRVADPALDESGIEGYPLQNRRAITEYGRVYLAEREHYADATHATDCKRCGPSGRPAPAGSPLSEAHKNARALRRISKEVLRDLWLIAREHHAGIPASTPAPQFVSP